ncbi:Kin of IRRE-like protein 1 [Trachymyrmex septentrionalis]|uniref:Kin of IRRE-like protein 1 n=1 Tax=Trachymyrmex septentrionalis TaxID=34720 RepID=A0A195FDU2_9HYME|nr:Kin of IRRE-like protein 1 [Trachymyrmex septentrionalis]
MPGCAFVKFTDAINVTTGSSGRRSLAYRPFVGLTVTNFGGNYGRAISLPDSRTPNPLPSGRPKCRYAGVDKAAPADYAITSCRQTKSVRNLVDSKHTSFYEARSRLPFLANVYQRASGTPTGLRDFSLHIYPVELEDDGTYQCQASPTNDGQPALRSRFAKLSVLVPPQKPKILQGDFLVTTEDRELVIECISSAGKPPAEATVKAASGDCIWKLRGYPLAMGSTLPRRLCSIDFTFSRISLNHVISECLLWVEAMDCTSCCEVHSAERVVPRNKNNFESRLITWIDGLGNVLRHGIKTTKEAYDNGPLITVKSVLRVMPRKDHDNTTFTCQSQNMADRSPQSAKLRVEVRYAPKVSLSKIDRIVEGSELRFKCCAEANPPDVEYRWFINKRKVIGDYTTEMIIHNATRELHDATVKCEVSNEVGKSEESQTLDVRYGPQFRHPPLSVETYYGATEILQCDVDGNPMPEIKWYYEDSDRMVANSPNISVVVSSDTAGRYYCKAHVHGFPELTGHANIYIRAPPSIVSQRIQYVPDEGVVKVKCTAISVPKAESVVWSFAGRELNFTSNNTPFYVQEEYAAERIVSTITLLDPISTYFGDYNCTVTNSFGTDSVIIKLTAHTLIPVDWQLILIIAGLVVCVILIGIIVILILQCRDRIKQPRPRTAQNQETDLQETDSNADRYRESDRSSNLSDVKADIRAGSSVSNAESVTALDSEGEGSTRGVNALALAGPVPNPLSGYRYSADYTEPSFPPKNNDGSNNNGYVPYVDYTRDYMPPTTQSMGASRESLSRISTSGILSSKKIGLSSANLGSSTPQTTPIDPRFSATYGNPYLRMSAAEQLRHAPHTAVPGVTPAPPPYTQAMRMNSLNTLNGAGPQVGTIAPLSAHYITGGPNGAMATVKRTSAVGTLATHTSRHSLGPRPATLRSTTRDARRLVDASEQSQCRYNQTRHAHDTERYRAEYERLVERRSQGSRGSRGHGGVADRAQRMAENGEALKHIELVLRQLQRASRDHQQLVRQRHSNVQYEIGKRINERIWHHRYHHHHHHYRDGRESSIDASRTWSRSSSSSPWESDLTLRKTQPNVTTRLLTKRRDYGGTAQSTINILKPVSGRVRDGTADTYQEMEFDVPESVDWMGARETFEAWSLPGASSSNDRRTSSTVV